MLKALLLAVTLLMLHSCGTTENCYAPDDFGSPIVSISSRYNKDELEMQGLNQVAPWRETEHKYQLTGRTIHMVVHYSGPHSSESTWCPWFGTNSDKYQVPRICERLQECDFIDGEMCTQTRDAQIVNAPCRLAKGAGLYLLLAEPKYDPNLSISSMTEPKGKLFHLGQKQSEHTFFHIAENGQVYQTGGIIYDYENSTALRTQFVNGGLFFKILHRYYTSSGGKVTLTIKSGVTSTETRDPMTYLTNVVKGFIFGGNNNDYGLIRRIYQEIIENNGYRSAVSALMTLYVMYTGLSYLIGNVNLSQSDMIGRIVKLAIVNALLTTETSWSFFYNYLFIFFVDGLQQILNMITETGSSGAGNQGILALIMAPQTMAKLFSLLFVDWRGFIYIILFLIAIYFVLRVFFDFTVIYLVSLMTIGVLIALGPIFVTFILFGFTRSLFENWLKALCSAAIKPIFLFCGTSIVSLALLHEIQGTLGIRVCKHFFPNLRISGAIYGGAESARQSPFYWWFPSAANSTGLVDIPIPHDHIDENGKFCAAYQCIGKRYINFPFIDPKTKQGQDRLFHFENGEFVQFNGLILIFISIFLLHQFNRVAMGIGQFISGSWSGSAINPTPTAQRVTAGLAHVRNTISTQVQSSWKELRIGTRKTFGTAAANRTGSQPKTLNVSDSDARRASTSQGQLSTNPRQDSESNAQTSTIKATENRTETAAKESGSSTRTDRKFSTNDE